MSSMNSKITVQGICIPDLKRYYRAIVKDNDIGKKKNRKKKQKKRDRNRNRIENLDKNLYYNNHLILSKDVIKHTEEKDSHSINFDKKIVYLHV